MAISIFLDIDGVLVHAIPHKKVELEGDGFYRFNPKSVEVLNHLLQLYTDHELILSTSHRFKFKISEWKELFERRGVYIQKLSIINIPLEPHISRKTEILIWIELCGFEPENIKIIDDDKSLNELPENLKSRLVITNPYTGLIDISEIKMI